MESHCPLCQSTDLKCYFKSKDSDYFICAQCELVFAPAEYHLSDIEEKSRHDLHQNNPQDLHYRQFLSKVFNPVLEHISPNAIGLDFGSGPGPTLCIMFSERGYQLDLFDKFYANNASIFNNHYDFITLTEVVEHFDKPRFELDRLFAMLNDDGILSIMTNMLNSDTNFEYWHYKNDPTHICFFSQATMNHLANKWGAKVKFYGDNVVLFFKRPLHHP
jgi:hypothetical protein